MSEKAIHTPTPWTAERDLPHNRMPRVHGGDTSTICECGNMGTSQDQWEANAAFIVRTVNSHAALVEALDTIFSRISYINIHGVGEQPAPDPEGNPQPMRVSVETFHYIWKEIGDIAAAALKLAESGQ